MLANPAIPLETPDGGRRADLRRRIVSDPVLNLIKLMLRRGRIEQLPRVAAEFRRLDNARQGITIATATSAAPLDARTRSAALTRGSNR